MIIPFVVTPTHIGTKLKGDVEVMSLPSYLLGSLVHTYWVERDVYKAQREVLKFTVRMCVV